MTERIESRGYGLSLLLLLLFGSRRYHEARFASGNSERRQERSPHPVEGVPEAGIENPHGTDVLPQPVHAIDMHRQSLDSEGLREALGIGQHTLLLLLQPVSGWRRGEHHPHQVLDPLGIQVHRQVGIGQRGGEGQAPDRKRDLLLSFLMNRYGEGGRWLGHMCAVGGENETVDRVEGDLAWAGRVSTDGLPVEDGQDVSWQYAAHVVDDHGEFLGKFIPRCLDLGASQGHGKTKMPISDRCMEEKKQR